MIPLAIGHGCVDVYQGAVAALVPFLVADRHYGYAAASGVVLAASLLSSVAQPVFGWLTDRRPAPWLLPVGTAAAGLGIALCGIAGPYAGTLAAVALSGIGVAAYHPESARVARQAGGASHTAMGVFALGGNVGFAVAPLLVTPVVAAAGLAGTPVLALPALLGVLLVLAASRGRRSATPAAVRTGGVDDRRAFVRLTVVVGLRSIVFVGLASFLAVYVRQRVGGGPAVGAAALFVLYLGGAVGTVLGGRLAESWGRVRVVRRSYAVAVPAIAGVLLVPGPACFAFVALTSAALYLPFSVQVTLGQDYLPSRVGTASGVTLGLAVSVGGVASPLIGALADACSLGAALAPLAVLPVAAWLVARTLPEPRVAVKEPARA